MRPDRSPGSRPASSRRVVVVGGGAAGTVVTIQLLQQAGPGVHVTIVEPRPTVGQGVAFGTPDPWHRLNVPAVSMSALPEDPEHFVRWGGMDPHSFPDRHAYGRYLADTLAATATASPATWEHRRATATRLRDEGGRMTVAVEVVPPADAPMAPPARAGGGDAPPGGGSSAPALLPADAVVVATGNALPAIPAFLAGLGAARDPRFVADPWAPGGLEAIEDGERVGILGTGHTALDLCASVLRSRPACRVVAMSRHGELPRAHEDPWRPRPVTPLFDLEAFRRFEHPVEEAVAAIRACPDGWRQAMDSLRPIHQQLWLAMGDEARRRFLADWRRTWEVHRSRIPAPMMREVEAWIDAGRLEVRAMTPESATVRAGRLVVASSQAALELDRLLLATGPDERPAATPFLATGIADGWLRDGPHGLGIDADPATLRVRDGTGATPRAVFALGPILRGLLFETIALPEIRAEAARIAASIAADEVAGEA